MLLVLAGLGWCGLAAAQTPAAAPAATQPAPAPSGSVELRVVQFGPGDLARPGDWTGVQIGVRELGTRPRVLSVRMTLPDPDGDRLLVQGEVTSVPGQESVLWLYARLPFLLGATPTVLVEAIEPDATGGLLGGGTPAGGAGAGGASALGVPAGRGGVVGSVQHAPRLAPATSALMAVVGREDARLDQYAVRFQQFDWMPLGHEGFERPARLKVSELPDRWMGLSGLEALVWTGRDDEHNPAKLSEAQRQAIIEWVTRGGHLVIVPPVTDVAWLDARANPLVEIMPAARPERLDGVDLNPLRLVFARPPVRVTDAPLPPVLPTATSVRVFHPLEGSAPQAAMGVLPGPAGSADGKGPAALVVRRLVGAGMVTLVGVDLLSPAMAQSDFEADVFWHRVLGRRGQIEDANSVQVMATGSATMRPIMPGNRGERFYDRGVSGAIAKTGRAAAGLLVAFGVFALYWLLAGPLGFAVLRRRASAQHAWLLFVLAGVVFTGIAWGAAGLARPRQVEGQHLTILDAVHGQSVQRARGWLSLLLPTHGSSEVRVDQGESGGLRNALAPWDAPADSLLGTPAFPDARGYVASGRDPSGLTVPTRATVKQWQIDWAGPVAWRLPMPVKPGAGGVLEPGGEIRLADRDQRRAALEGVLIHNLPGPLDDVTIIVVERQELRKNTAAGALPSNVTAFRLPASRQWMPGEPMDLASVTVDSAGSRGEEFLASLVPPLSTAERAGGLGEGPDTAFAERLSAVGLLSMFEPPDLSPQSSLQPLARRRLTHGWDLGRWFTQPTVIVLGHLVSGPMPMALTVDGEGGAGLRDRISGRTLVRWVYPLPSVLPAVPQEGPGGPVVPEVPATPVPPTR
jgi:hypothetical protein